MSLKHVREQCARVADQAHISIDADQVDAFLRGIRADEFDALKLQHGLRFPLRFASFHHKLNFIAVLSMLNAFSGYRVDFHRVTGHGAYDCVRRIVLAMYLTTHDEEGHTPLDAHALETVTVASLAQALGVPTHTETPHPTIPFITVGTVGGPLQEPLELAAQMCTETAAFLREHGYQDLASYVLDVCEQALEQEHVEAYMASQLARISAFDDAINIDGVRVCLWKKALFFVHALYNILMDVDEDSVADLPAPLRALARRWRHGLCEPLPMFVDNVIPTILSYLGILRFHHEHVLASWHPAPQGDNSNVPGPTLERRDAYCVRAAALIAGSRIIERAHDLANTDASMAWMACMTEEQLDAYIWTRAKSPVLRSIPRLVERLTGMY